MSTFALLSLGTDSIQDEIELLREEFPSNPIRKLHWCDRGIGKQGYIVQVHHDEMDALRDILKEHGQTEAIIIREGHAKSYNIETDTYRTLGQLHNIGPNKPNTKSYTQDVRTGNYYLIKEGN
jgi:hypothetical protein